MSFRAEIKPSGSPGRPERTKVVEAPGGQALGEVGGEQEAGEEGEEEVVAVAGQGVGGAADAAAAQEDLQDMTVSQARHRYRWQPQG